MTAASGAQAKMCGSMRSTGKCGRLFHVILSVSFLIFLAAPHALELFSRSGDTTSIEKRESSPMPGSGLILTSFAQYARQFDRYYSESFGLRDRLIHWNNALRHEVFGESAPMKVRVGRDGWLFYAMEMVLDDFEQVIPYSQQELDNMFRVLDERRAWLERRGIRFFVFVAPNKPTIYSEYLPPHIRKIGRESRLDQLGRLLEKAPGIEFVNAREALLAAKPGRRLYNKTDTHWNDYGAFVVYTELMDRLSRHFRSIRKQTLDEYTISIEKGPGGDLAGLLSLQDTLTEDWIKLQPKFTPKAHPASADYPEPVTQPGRNTVIMETGDPSLPKAVIFRDSFAWALIPFLSENFQRSVYVWTNDFLPGLIEHEKPEVVIMEVAERYINGLSRENPPEVREALPGATHP